jgi:hypothetical protein
MTIILIILAIYAYLYYTPKFEKLKTGHYIVWYTYRNEITPGNFKRTRRYIHLNKFKL